MKCLLLAVVLITGFCLVAIPATLDEIRETLIESHLALDDDMSADTDVKGDHWRGACLMCGGDTNRLANIVCELAKTNDIEMAREMIDNLGSCGTSSQLPFLYSIVTNEQYEHFPARAILRIEGVTSNSVAMVRRHLSMTNICVNVRSEVYVNFLRTLYSTNTTAAAKALGMEFVRAHARTCEYPAEQDAVLCGLDSTYKRSRRRLSVLRANVAHGVDQWDIGYVTNAINEMVAYPESALGE